MWGALVFGALRRPGSLRLCMILLWTRTLGLGCLFWGVVAASRLFLSRCGRILPSLAPPSSAWLARTALGSRASLYFTLICGRRLAVTVSTLALRPRILVLLTFSMFWGRPSFRALALASTAFTKPLRSRAGSLSSALTLM
eukprot:Amastigsp_a844620_13.p3 type:complete len:141 gc:universal Amastigsp_a844620_13:1208-786(-)